MTIRYFLTLTACAACLYAQTPAEKAWNILTTASQDKSYEKRAKAIHSLGLIPGDARAEAAAVAALSDEREEVRSTAADVLGVMQAKGSVPKLKAALKDPATAVVFAAANALYVMGDPDVFRVYFAILTGETKSGDPLLQSQLKMLKDPKALTQMGLEAGIGFVPFGGVSYKVFKMATDDAVSPVRSAAALKLVNDPDPKTAQALVKATTDPKWMVRAAAIGAIARRNDASLLKGITNVLDDENDIVRFNAAAAVIHLSSRATSTPKPAAKK